MNKMLSLQKIKIYVIKEYLQLGRSNQHPRNTLEMKCLCRSQNQTCRSIQTMTDRQIVQSPVHLTFIGRFHIIHHYFLQQEIKKREPLTYRGTRFFHFIICFDIQMEKLRFVSACLEQCFDHLFAIRKQTHFAICQIQSNKPVMDHLME